MAPISLQQAFTGLQNLLKDISDVPQATFVQWCEFVQEFTYRYLVGIDPERFIVQTNLSIVNGTASYALPVDFHDMQSWDTGLFMTDSQGNNTGVRLPLTSPGSGGGTNGNLGLYQGGAFAGYFINGDNLVITPTPTQSLTLIHRYVPTITVLDNINQFFTLDGTVAGFPIIPYEYLQYLVRALAAQYMIWDEDVNGEGFADQRYVRALDEMCENIRRQPQAVPVLDFSSMY